MIRNSVFFLLLILTTIQAEIVESSMAEQLHEIKKHLREIFHRLDQLEVNANLVPSAVPGAPTEPAGRNLNQIRRSIEKISEQRNETSRKSNAVRRSSSVNMHAAGRSARHAERLVKILAEIVTAPGSQKFPAHVTRTKIFVDGVTPKVFSCDSRGQPLDSCFWGRMKNGTHQVVLIDHRPAQNRSSAERIAPTGGGLDEGKCTLTVESLLENDVGHWSCTLVAKTGAIYSGEVDVIDALNEQIYFATAAGGIKSYTLKTSIVSTILESSDYLLGIAFDSVANKLYWCKEDTIYRADRDGSGSEILLNTRNYGPLEDLALDQVTNTLYVAVGLELILACDTRHASFNCTTILRAQGYLLGIKVNPSERSIYYTTYTEDSSSIFKAGTDGSNPLPIVTGLGEVHGMAIDNEGGRLLWTDEAANKIQSSNLTGGDLRTLVQLSDCSGPYGIVLFNGKIYWGNRVSKTLQSCAMDGADVRTMYEGTDKITHMAIVPAEG